MGEITTIGLDIAKTVFQAHGADASGSVVFRKKLSRGRLLAFFAAQPPCLVALEACAGSHHWGRELARLGHTVRLFTLTAKGRPLLSTWIQRQGWEAPAITRFMARPHKRASVGSTRTGRQGHREA